MARANISSTPQFSVVRQVRRSTSQEASSGGGDIKGEGTISRGNVTRISNYERQRKPPIASVDGTGEFDEEGRSLIGERRE